MSMLTERITPAWVIQFYSGMKSIFYLLSLALVPFEIRAGHAFNHSPYSDFPELGWRLGLRMVTLAFWIVVFLWAGGKLWAASQKERT